MKLSMEIIRDSLKISYFSRNFCSKDETLHYNRPVLFIDQDKLKTDNLYISLGNRIPEKIMIEPGAGLICLGMPPARITSHMKEVLVLDFSGNMDGQGNDGSWENLLRLSNEINRIYDFFDSWERELEQAIEESLQELPYQKLLDISSDIFQNGLSIMTSDNRITAENKTNRKKAGYDSFPVSGQGEMAEEVINDFKNDPDYLKIMNARAAFLYSSRVLPNRCLCKNVFIGDQFVLRIIITECVREIRRTDYVLLDFLSGFFERCLLFSHVNQPVFGMPLASLLCDMLESGIVARPAMENELLKMNWNSGDTYRLILIYPSTGDHLISALNFFCRKMQEYFPKACVFQYHDAILMLTNESRGGDMYQYFEKLRIFIRENNFRAGLSSFKNDIYQLKQMLHQAETAFSLGSRTHPMEWIHSFSRYAFPNILEFLTNGMEKDEICSPVYFRLERYDQENGSEYLKTLQAYLMSGMNAMQTAQTLHIQRSTMIYRLKRIREIGKCSLNDNDELLHLFLTFRILKHESDAGSHK